MNMNQNSAKKELYMTEIEENNKLIVEFIGAEYIQDDYGDWGYKHKDFPHWNKMQSLKALKYHSSYDWLMPVVNKCIEICNNEMLNEWENGFIDAFMSTNIDKLYKETVDFIKWYNEYGKEKA